MVVIKSEARWHQSEVVQFSMGLGSPGVRFLRFGSDLFSRRLLWGGKACAVSSCLCSYLSLMKPLQVAGDECARWGMLMVVEQGGKADWQAPR